jgi:hypothetical protein
LEKLLTPEVVRDYPVINHEPEHAQELVQFGTTRDGTPALLNRHLAEADVRIITGFIEPHFFAGFSGGPKGIMPGVAGLRTVMSNHGEKNIGDPKSTFGITIGNPIWEEMRDIALRVGPSFLLNVTLNEQRQITGVFAGDLLQAHKIGIEFVRKSAMQKVKSPFEIVVTTNSGYPLDLNLYQGVKGMSAGGRILQEGGTLILACECKKQLPNVVLCSDDRLLPPSFVRRVSQERLGITPDEIGGGHCAALSRPRELANMLDSFDQPVLLFCDVPTTSFKKTAEGLGNILVKCIELTLTPKFSESVSIHRNEFELVATTVEEFLERSK